MTGEKKKEARITLDTGPCMLAFAQCYGGARRDGGKAESLLMQPFGLCLTRHPLTHDDAFFSTYFFLFLAPPSITFRKLGEADGLLCR